MTDSDWKSRVQACFHADDFLFAQNPLSRAGAYRFLGALLEEGIGWPTVKAEIRAMLVTRGASEFQIMRQMRRVESRLRPWLDDLPGD